MNYRVLLRKNSTGEVREIDGGEWHEASEFLWTEGNFSCDCNRAILFERAVGKEIDDDESVCGYTAYTAIKAFRADGVEIKLDGAE